jgi:hypothetical protein
MRIKEMLQYQHRNLINLAEVSPALSLEYFTSKCKNITLSTRAVCKVSGLTLLLRVGTLYRCGDGPFF